VRLLLCRHAGAAILREAYGHLIVPLTLAIWFVAESAYPQEASPLPAVPMAARRLFVDPSSSRVKLGKADLALTALAPKGDMYVGEYRLRVVPYFFKNEQGSLALTAPKESYQRLAQGSAVEFKGVATNKKNGKRKIITGKITPITSDRGRVTFSVETENGQMVFNTLYHFVP
jgi:hypothetical protein